MYSIMVPHSLTGSLTGGLASNTDISSLSHGSRKAPSEGNRKQRLTSECEKLARFSRYRHYLLTFGYLQGVRRTEVPTLDRSTA